MKDLVPKPPRDRNFRKRLGVYLAGVGIGLMILGAAQLSRMRYARSQQAQSPGDAPAGAVEQPAPPGP